MASGCREGKATMLDGAITIGRGAGTRALVDSRWSRFCLVTVELARSYAPVIYVQNRGLGQWDGQPEENFVVIFGGVTNSDPAALCSQLRWLARKFDQDGIALLLGSSELITPLAHAVEEGAAHVS